MHLNICFVLDLVRTSRKYLKKCTSRKGSDVCMKVVDCNGMTLNHISDDSRDVYGKFSIRNLGFYCASFFRERINVKRNQ